MEFTYPEYLRNYSNLIDFFEKELEDLNTKQKGDKFAKLAQKTIKHTEFGNLFPEPAINSKASHDNGVDLFCQDNEGRKHLYVQSKYRIVDKNSFNSVISEFEKFDIDTSGSPDFFKVSNTQGELNFGQEYYFSIVTMHRLDRIIKNYINAGYPTVPFYEKLLEENKIKVIDGSDILSIYQKLYKATYVVPPTIEIEFDSDLIAQNDVYVGILGAPKIKKIHDDFRDSIFFENVRNFQGFGGEVNQEILETAKNMPATMLEKNNGITFRASRVEVLSAEKPRTLKLTDASIVNGCQTTICLAQKAFPDAKVLVKVVQAKEKKSWEITKAANFQNQVSKLDLGIAKYARPQAIEKVAQKLGINVRDSNSSIFELMESISDISAAPSEIRSLFIALFSTTPANTVDLKFDRIKTDLLDSIWSADSDGTKTLEPVFMLHVESSKALHIEIQKQNNLNNAASKSLFEVFKRFKSERGSSYRAFLAVLAVSVAIGKNIYTQENRSIESFTIFLEDIQKTLNLEKEKFYKTYKEALLTIVNEVVNPAEKDYDKVLQDMYNRMKDMNFGMVFDKTVWNLQSRN